ncbi:MAG: hypothetical protein A2Y25_00420 [Candidatus Melainabacteria bacterium GWF2_37_15]|nr:MAG: hypothetical protein A2Y25_00420 [Candidatus Melainabacteria bacterium GWF2_37_15]
MKNLMEYKGYLGSVEYSEEDDCLLGKIQGIRSLISYEGQTVQELKNDFHAAVDEYLEHCDEVKKEPEKPFKGGFNVRINPELHRAAYVFAQQHETSLNNFVAEAIEEKIKKEKKSA